MKKLMLVIVLLLCAAVLFGCAQSNEPQRFQVIGQETQAPAAATQVVQAQVTAAPVGTIDFDDGSYDPSKEEGGSEGTDIMIDTGALNNAPVIAETSAPTINSAYAGATPVVIDPINKPTPTPVPAIAFTYEKYEASKLHLSFEAPVAWTVDDTMSDTYILTNPNTGIDYAAFINVRTIAVTKDYSKNNLATEVRQMLSTVSADFATFSHTNTAERTLLGKTGVYADYTATTRDGAEVSGRIHITYMNKTLYAVHMSYPRSYAKDYKDNVYSKFRKTLTVVQ